MKTYQFDQTVLYSNNYTREITLSDDIVFCESAKYSDNQRFFFIVIKDATDEDKKQLEDNKMLKYQFGNLTIATLDNVMPLCDIPIIDVDEINKRYVPDLRNMIIVSEVKNNEYIYKLLECRKAMGEDGKFNEEAEKLMEELKEIEPKYIESICRPLKFVTGGDKSPLIECDCVQFKSWLRPEVVNVFQKTNLAVNKLTNNFNEINTIYMGDEFEKWKKVFTDRIVEITRTAFE